MTQNSANSPAAEVWRRMIGMYGADTVARKYGKSIPEEWEAMLHRLQEYQIQRGIRMLAYSGKPHVPSLPEFVKLCRDAEHDRGPSTQVALPNPEDGKYDRWDLAANRHLWNYIFAQMKIRVFSEAETRILVSYKNAWARDMREGDLDSETGEIKPPSIEIQKAAWKDCMERAEAAIAQKAAA